MKNKKRKTNSSLLIILIGCRTSPTNSHVQVGRSTDQIEGDKRQHKDFSGLYGSCDFLTDELKCVAKPLYMWKPNTSDQSNSYLS